MMVSHYPRRRITLTACVLLGLGFALLRLPLDQKSYAKESHNFLRTEGNSGRNGKQRQQPRQQQQREQLKEKPEQQKGGMVRLSELKSVPVNHDGSGATKQTMILNGQVPHLTGFTRAVFSPGDEVELHKHLSMDEVFYAAEGRGVIEVEGTVVQLTPGTCVHVAAGQKHSLENTGDVDMVLFYFGIAVESATDEGGGGGEGKASRKGGGGGGGGKGNALHAIGVVP